MTVAAIVVAAGRGQRFGGLKQFASLGDRSVASLSVAAARSVADRVVLVVPSDYAGDGEGADLVVEGGATRAASVRAGLAGVGDCEIVVVHDAARPAAPASLFEAVVEAVTAGAEGAVPGLPLADTVKVVIHEDLETVVVETLERDRLMAVQTPQAFRREALVRAHTDGAEATDDAALVEAQGGRVVVVPGEPGNIKITVAEDLHWVAARGLS